MTMTRGTLVRRSLRYYWRTHLAVTAGVAVAVSVLAGALLVGDSVRASLRGLVDERLGRVTHAATGQSFFRDTLDEAIATSGGSDAAAIIALDGAVVHEPSGRQASRVQVYGIDEAFLALQGRPDLEAPRTRAAWLSPALSGELGAAGGDSLLLRVQKPSAIPAGTLQGRRNDTTRAIRLTTREMDADSLGDFTIRPQQDAGRAVFVPLSRLQRDLDLPSRANVLLLGADARGDVPAGEDVAQIERRLAEVATFEDLGLKLVPLAEAHGWSLESETGLLGDDLLAIADARAGALGYRTTPVLTYIANTIRVGAREVPYSVVSGVDLAQLVPQSSIATGPPPIAPVWLNGWAAEDLDARPGDTVTLEYYLWSDEGGLSTSQAEFVLAGTLPMEGIGGDRTLTPQYPGLTDAGRIGDWDPPFPVDLRRIRDRDEQYWDRYRAAPKAFVSLKDARRLWSSPYGTATSLRVFVPADVPLETAREALSASVSEAYTPADAGLAVQPVRAQALAASRGATNFGEYFVYFSFFIVVSGLLLTGLFFKLGVEQRAREIGLLSALGFTAGAVRRLLFAESLALAVVGAAIGAAGAIAFGAVILHGLRTWWVDAVGTTRLDLAVDPLSIAAGAFAGVLIALAVLALTLRRLATAAPRDLLSGLALSADPRRLAGRPRTVRLAASPAVRLVAGLASAALLVGAALAGYVGEVPAFFGAGAVVLLSSLAAAHAWLLAGGQATVHGHGRRALFRLGARQATAHPGRSVLSMALIAFATFVIVAVGAFRRGAPEDAHDPHGGTGGYALFAESAAPLMFDPGTREGRVELGVPDDPALAGVTVMRFRLRPGEDGSCLNLYRPTSPRLIAPTAGFVERGGFAFADTLAETPEERTNPWRLLNRRFADGAIPVIGDANSLQYVLHVGVGGDLVIPGADGEPVVLRVVAALADSVFQSELIIPEEAFVRRYPRLEGYRFFVVATPRGRVTEVATLLEDALADYGFDAQSTSERLASYHRVENTYLSTFQALGGLGLLLGTLGLGAVLLRNVLERRRELALLQAVGYRSRALGLLVIAESALLLVAGLSIGTGSAVLAILPALSGRGAQVPLASTLGVLLAVLAAGLLASLAATRAAASSPLLATLRAE